MIENKLYRCILSFKIFYSEQNSNIGAVYLYWLPELLQMLCNVHDSGRHKNIII